MKIWKKHAAIVLALLMVLTAGRPIPVFAETNCRFQTLSPGKWAKNSHRYDLVNVDYVYYVVTLKEAGALNFTLKNAYGDGYVKIYKSKKEIIDNKLGGTCHNISTFHKNKMVALEKGTYYLDVETDQCKYTFTAAGKPDNYCPAKAKRLKANTKVKIIYNPRMVFDRWYKITNPKRKKIRVYTNNSGRAWHATVYTSKLKPLIYTHDYAGDDFYYVETKDPQPKGTYYIRVRSIEKYTFGAYGTVDIVKWK